METITVLTKDDFRRWLFVNHENQSKVAVVLFKKHTGKPAPSARDLMEEAIYTAPGATHSSPSLF